MVSNVEFSNIGPEKAEKSSGQSSGCGFLVLQSLRQAGAQGHTEELLMAITC